MQKVFIGIDESGASIYKGLKNVFVISAVCIDGEESFLSFSKKIIDQNDLLKIREFKFSKSTANQVEKYEKILGKFNLKIFSVSDLITEKDDVENIYTRSLFKLISKIKLEFRDNNLDIRVDRFGGDKKEKEIKKEILKILKPESVKVKIEFTKSQNSTLVQMADLCAGKERRDILKNEIKEKNK